MILICGGYHQVTRAVVMSAGLYKSERLEVDTSFAIYKPCGSGKMIQQLWPHFPSGGKIDLLSCYRV
jgi:hypothetical protein